MMRNYHRSRGHAKCAFKIDIEKAYDSVGWDFLANCLKFFGFHDIMVKWVMNCVSSASFTINVNGDHKDDLFLFCNGDSKSVSIMKNALTEFSGMSGLLPNCSKSLVFFGNVRDGCRRKILGIMPFKEGTLPVRYLEVPLISKRLYVKDCHVLIDKARKRILDWKNKSLSFAGRLQLIKSVISSMQVYWASMFILPVSISNDIEKLMRDFLWKFRVFKRGKSLINWNSVCKMKVEGGLGIKSLDSWNIALMSKHIWNVITNKESLWVQWVNTYRLKGRSFWDILEKEGSCWAWKKILKIRGLIKDHIFHKISDGRNTSLWSVILDSFKIGTGVYEAADIWSFYVCNDIGSKRVKFAARNNSV
nr:hypothetical protein [Tanacetum cinerariifolium]